MGSWNPVRSLVRTEVLGSPDRGSTPVGRGRAYVAGVKTVPAAAKEPFMILSIIDSLSCDTKERGQGLAEYALILSLIAIIAIAALVFLGGEISALLSLIGAQV